MDWYKFAQVLAETAQALSRLDPQSAQIGDVKNALYGTAASIRSAYPYRNNTDEEIAQRVFRAYRTWVAQAYGGAIRFYQFYSDTDFGYKPAKTLSTMRQIMRKKFKGKQPNGHGARVPPETKWPRLPKWALAPEAFGLSANKIAQFLAQQKAQKKQQPPRQRPPQAPARAPVQLAPPGAAKNLAPVTIEELTGKPSAEM